MNNLNSTKKKITKIANMVAQKENVQNNEIVNSFARIDEEKGFNEDDFDKMVIAQLSKEEK